MPDFKDKLTKKKKIKIDPLQLIVNNAREASFCKWLEDHFYSLFYKKLFSLKRIARIFVSKHPELFYQFDDDNDLEKNIRLAQDHSCWEDD